MSTTNDNSNAGNPGAGAGQDRPDVDLVAYVLDEVDRREKRRIEGVLAANPELDAECADIRRTLTLVSAAPDPPVSDGLTRRAKAAYRRFSESVRRQPNPRLGLRELPSFVFAYVRFRFRASAGFRALTLATCAHAALFLLIAGVTIVRYQQDLPVPPVGFAPTADDESGLEPIAHIDTVLPREPEPSATPRPDLRELPVPSPIVSEDMPGESIDDPARLWPRVASNSDRLRIGRWILFARHRGDRRADLLQQYGGSETTEKAVTAALDWLARQQSDDGSWDVEAMGGDRHYGPGATGLALLAFLGGGHSLTEGRHSAVVERAVRNLVDLQTPAGRFGQARDSGRTYLYNHAIATQALIECYVMSPRARELREPIEKGIRLLERMQNEDGGWRYTRLDGQRDRSDSSVTGWVLQTLTMAHNAGFINSGSASLQAARTFLENMTEDTGKVRYLERNEGREESLARIASTYLALDVADPDSTRSGATRRRAALLAGVATERDWLHDRVSLHLVTRAMFQIGGSRWTEWNALVSGLLVDAQTDDGSFAPGPLYGANGGRVVSTALAVLTLEVYYRYPRIHR